MNRAKAHALVLLAAAGACLPACGLNQAGVEPPKNTIAFPASAVMDSSGDWLFVTNANADLRYNDGTLLVLSLVRAAAERDTAAAPPSCTTNDDCVAPLTCIEGSCRCATNDDCVAPLTCIGGSCGWPACPQVSYSNPRTDPNRFCCWDALDRSALNCDERYYVGSDADAKAALADPKVPTGNGNVRIGSFAAAMVLQQRKCPTTDDLACKELCQDAAGDDRLLIGVRGDTSLTFVDVGPSTPETPPTLTCSNPVEEFATCDDTHRINKTTSALAAPTADPMPPEVTLPDEPYALALDDTNGLLYVGHLTGNTSRPLTGGFSLFDVMPFGDAPLGTPRLISSFPSPFTPSSLGAVGVSALKAYPRGNDRTSGVTNIFASSRFVPQVASLGVTAVCPRADTPIREIAAFPNGPFYTSPLTGTETRGIEFVDNRAFILQRSPPALISFLDTNTPSEVLETCASPTFLDKQEKRDNGVGDRLFVTCSADGEIYVFDPALPQLVRTFIVGRGPAGLVFDKKRHVAYSINFGDNDVAVIDLVPGSPTEYHVIQRIGFPRTTPR